MAIIKTIRLFTDVLEEVFGDTAITKDIYEEFERPCTYITPTSIEVEAIGGQVQETIGITITRFGSFDYKGYLELLQYAEVLTRLLTAPVMVERFAVYPEDVNIDINREEEVLECTFSVVAIADETLEKEAESAAEYMEHLRGRLHITNFEESELIV